MSNTETVAALKTAFAGYENNDRGPLTALLADDFTFEMSDSVPYGGNLRRAGGVRRLLARGR
jgi:uncharacterized protein